MIGITAHAIQRFQQRVAPVTRAEAIAAIMAHHAAFVTAHNLGGATVRSSDGVRYVVKDGHVVTVIGARCRFNHPRKAA